MTAPNNIVGVDPHRKTFTATVLDARGGELSQRSLDHPARGRGPTRGPRRAGDRPGIEEAAVEV